MEELAEKYPHYGEMDVGQLDEELPFFDKDLRESGTNEEEIDIGNEIAYVQELRRRKVQEEAGEGDLTGEQLAAKYPELSELPYDDLMDRGDRLLNDMILAGLDEEDFKEKSEELRYIRMLSNEFQRKSNLNKLLNLRDKVKKRGLVKRNDNRKLELFKIWARENAGVLSAVFISSAAVIVGLVVTTRSMAWKLGDESKKINEKLNDMVKNQMKLPPVFLKLADGLEAVGDNIWNIIAGAIGVIFLIYKLS
ncbi:Hypothetical predicted protein [Paramuricea clavata]|uniref:Uncharacterized protein n=1 Tax=Paramuricea clavata TaxID=317549 RepID=A0A7D9ESB3_PARCT|nr:Hypothetical predicted protein [Paramuricea clavata]